MLKIFTTQLFGLFQKINKEEEETLEDVSRMLAQAIVSDNRLFFHGDKELHAVALEAVFGTNTLPNTSLLFQEGELVNIHESDVVVLAIHSINNDTLKLLNSDQVKKANKIILAPSQMDLPMDSLDDTTFLLDIKSTDAIIPLNDDKKICNPVSLTALYMYYAMYLNTMEILDEFE